jgi:membrane fusion protein, multidrug efflux system
LKKNIILWFLLLFTIAGIAWKLQSNKQRLLAKTELSKIKRAFVPVEIVTPQYEILSNSLQADGVFMPFKEMFLISETAGKVLEVYKNKGENVSEGDIIAKVDDELLRIELSTVEANLQKLYKDHERLNNLIEGEAAPKNKIEELNLGILTAEAKQKALQKQIGNTSLKAPMTGTLGLRFIERGSVIGPGIQVAQLTNLDKLLLFVKVTEQDILQVRKGQQVKVTADVFNQEPLMGKVTNIGLKADNTFNYDVEIEVTNRHNNQLRAGMHAKAYFTFENQRRGLTLPRKTIMGSLLEGKIYVVHDSMASERKVIVGNTYGERVEILSGLTEKDCVVVSGQQNLGEETKIMVVGSEK